MTFRTVIKEVALGQDIYATFMPKPFSEHPGSGMHRFIPLMASKMGYRVVEFPVKHNERKYGASKYRSAKILTEVPDLLTMFFLLKYTTRPLHFFGRVGSALFAIGFACLAYLTILWAQSIPIGTRPLLLFGVLLVLIGGQTIFTGLLADLIVNVSQERGQEFPLKYSSDRKERRQEPDHSPVDIRQ
jgi:hypothetical protein